MKTGIKAINSAPKNNLAEIKPRKVLQELFYRWMQAKSSPEKAGAN